MTECGKAEEKGLLSTPSGARREQPWLRMTVTVAEMKHCPPVASQQATPTRSSKQNSKGWKGAHYKYHPASQTHPGWGGGDLEAGMVLHEADGGTNQCTVSYYHGYNNHYHAG